MRMSNMDWNVRIDGVVHEPSGGITRCGVRYSYADATVGVVGRYPPEERALAMETYKGIDCMACLTKGSLS